MSSAKSLLATAINEFASDRDPATDIAYVKRIQALNILDFPATARTVTGAGAAQFALSKLVNEVPASAGSGSWDSTGRFVWEVYEQLLTGATLPNVNFANGEPAEFTAARSVLFEDEAMTTPSDQLRIYREFKARWEAAQLALIATATDGVLGTTIITTAQEQVESAFQEWTALGHRTKVSNALAAMSRTAKFTPAAAWASALSDLRIAERANLDGGEYYSTQILPVGFDIRRDASWATLVSQTPSDIPQDVLLGLSLGEGDTLEIELAILNIERAWFDLNLIARRDWDWDGPSVSEGQRPNRGLLPAVADAVILMRHAVVTPTKVEPDSNAFIPDSPHRISLIRPDGPFSSASFMSQYHAQYRVRSRYRLYITDVEGQAIPSAVVYFSMRAMLRDNPGMVNNKLISHLTRTGADGATLIPNIWWNGRESREQQGTIWVRAEGYHPIIVDGSKWGSLTNNEARENRIHEERTNLTVVLSPLPEISIQVVTILPLTGKRVAVEGARVQLVALEVVPEIPSGRIWSGKTDQDGIVCFRHPESSVATNTTIINVDAKGYDIITSSILQQRAPLRKNEQYTTTLELVRTQPNQGGGDENDEACRLVAFITRRLPLAPNPDPALPWARQA